LSDVIYGDVWVCSGQSNMQWNIGGIFNASEEIAKMAEYQNIRMYFVKLMTSDEPQEDLMNEDWAIWAKSSQTNYVSAFSAVCLLTARYMADAIGKDKVLESNGELNIKY
jgi:sialate O-acetylesterase